MYWLLVSHLFGDFVLQTDWMAFHKKASTKAALIHSVVYTLPFALLMPRWEPLALIGVSHFVIDRFRLARFIIWLKNLMNPKEYRYPWSECSETGYHKSRPAWQALWLMVLTDNTLHLIFNGIAWELWG